MTRDLALAVRRLFATPLFLAFAVISLALGVSVTTTVYSVLYAVLWKPLGIADPRNVAVVTAVTGTSRAGWVNVMSTADFEDLRGRQRSFSDIAAFTNASQTIVAPAASEIHDIEAVTGRYFDTLGVRAALGRAIRPADDSEAAAVIVLSDRLWRRQFDADPAIVGKTVRVGGRVFEIVGVTPRSFDGLKARVLPTAAWIPFSAAPVRAAGSPAPGEDRERRRLTVFGRLASGRTAQTAATELTTIGSSLDAAFPIHSVNALTGSRQAIRRQWSARSVTNPESGSPEWRIAAVLLSITLLVLVVACTNLANLMLSRGTMRQHEFAVRRALGASRGRLVRELLAESVIIAAVGGICTLVLTQALLRLATWDVPTVRGAFSLEPTLNIPALLFASGSLLLAMLVFGLEPALALTRRTVTVQLASEGGGFVAPRSGRQRAFIRWQVAVSACFFLIASILVRVLVSEARHDSGIALHRLAFATVHLGLHGWDQNQARAVLGRALEIAREHKEIEEVALSSGMPFGMTMTSWATVTTPERPFVPGGRNEMTDVLSATPEIFRTLGVSIVRGRPFDDRDDAGAPRVAVLSEQTARELFGTVDAIGRQIVLQLWSRPPNETFTVVGIAKQTDSGRLMSRGNNTAYVPFAQLYQPNMAIVARTSGDPAALARTLQQVIRQADPVLGTGTAGPAFWMLAGPYVVARIGALLAIALGALTLVLAMVGLYGVQAQAVAHRTREVGVRMALGADAAQIARMVLRQGFRPVVEGMVLGLVMGTLARFAVRAILVAPIQIVDPVSLVLVPLPLGMAALLACYLPARRAARVDPNVALRHL